jgi:carbonic anhydrase
MGVTDTLLDNARDYAESFAPAPLSAAPALHLAVVACMDARIIPTRLLGLREGDAHVIRNAGGIITEDTIRSLAISQRKLGTTEIVLIHHTGCGLLGLDDDAFRGELVTDTGVEPGWVAGGFDDIDDSVRESIARLKASPFIPHSDNVRGFVYDVGSRTLREVR